MLKKSKPKTRNKNKHVSTVKDLSQLFKKHPEVELVRKISSLAEPISINKEMPLEQPNSYRL